MQLNRAIGFNYLNYGSLSPASAPPVPEIVEVSVSEHPLPAQLSEHCTVTNNSALRSIFFSRVKLSTSSRLLRVRLFTDTVRRWE